MIPRSPLKRRIRLIGAVAALVLIGGCASQAPQHIKTEQAIQAIDEIPEDALLDVGIEVLDTGLPPAGQPTPEGVFPELREAEARYIAIQLKNTMQGTGQWGVVRVLPGELGMTDVKVLGKILLSTGSKMAIDVRVVDATGRKWLDRRYRAEADELVYLSTGTSNQDPFQSLYNEISNDIVEARQKFQANQLVKLRQVTRMRFAASLAPDPFEDYLETDKKGRITTGRLPARDDPMMTRLDGIRASENLFIDTLDQHYAAFYDRMNAPYSSWRKYTYEEEKAYKALKRKALTQKILGGLAILGAALADPGSPAAAVVRDAAIIGGMAAINAGIGTSKEAKIHSEAIRELAASVETELEPIVIQVEGQTLRLSGSAETQYEEWRKLLREIWITETGLPIDPNEPVSSRSEEADSVPNRQPPENR
jgi:hypothetical protein